MIGARWASLPRIGLSDDKRPLGGRGFLDAQSGLSFTGDDLVGIASGAASGVDCLDFDVGEGMGRYEEWRQAGHIPKTRTQWTRRGGRHCFVIHQPGLRSRNGIVPSIDLKAGEIGRGGGGGYFVDWWRECLATEHEWRIAEWPSDLLAWIADNTKRRACPSPTPIMGDETRVFGGIDSQNGSDRGPYGERPKPMANWRVYRDYLYNDVIGAPKGRRRNTIFSAACRCGEAAEQGVASAEPWALAALPRAARSNGIAREVGEVVIEDNIRRGLEQGRENQRWWRAQDRRT